jgi:phospholipase C
MSRRDFLAKLTCAGASAFLMDWAAPVIEKAYGAGPCSGRLTDIARIVLLMQENRSFDHYFGTLSGTHGFNEASPLFQQKGWNPQTQSLDPTAITLPYRFDTTRGPLPDGECVFAVPPNLSAPSLENARLATLPKIVQCIPNVVLGTSDGVLPGIPYRVHYPQSMPTQETSPVRGIASGVC